MPLLADFSPPIRGADAITDHGAEYVVITQRIPTTIFLWPVVPFFSPNPSVSRQWELRPKGSVVFPWFISFLLCFLVLLCFFFRAQRTKDSRENKEKCE